MVFGKGFLFFHFLDLETMTTKRYVRIVVNMEEHDRSICRNRRLRRRLGMGVGRIMFVFEGALFELLAGYPAENVYLRVLKVEAKHI